MCLAGVWNGFLITWWPIKTWTWWRSWGISSSLSFIHTSLPCSMFLMLNVFSLWRVEIIEQLIQSSDLFVMQVEMDVYTALKKVFAFPDVNILINQVVGVYSCYLTCSVSALWLYSGCSCSSILYGMDQSSSFWSMQIRGCVKEEAVHLCHSSLLYTSHNFHSKVCKYAYPPNSGYNMSDTIAIILKNSHKVFFFFYGLLCHMKGGKWSDMGF